MLTWFSANLTNIAVVGIVLVLLALSLPMAWLLRLIPGAGKWLT